MDIHLYKDNCLFKEEFLIKYMPKKKKKKPWGMPLVKRVDALWSPQVNSPMKIIKDILKRRKKKKKKDTL